MDEKRSITISKFPVRLWCEVCAEAARQDISKREMVVKLLLEALGARGIRI